jgi:hypothetical protein
MPWFNGNAMTEVPKHSNPRINTGNVHAASAMDSPAHGCYSIFLVSAFILPIDVQAYQ